MGPLEETGVTDELLALRDEVLSGLKADVDSAAAADETIAQNLLTLSGFAAMERTRPHDGR